MGFGGVETVSGADDLERYMRCFIASISVRKK